MAGQEPSAAQLRIGQARVLGNICAGTSGVPQVIEFRDESSASAAARAERMPEVS